jgi:hypothetical protein
MTHRHTASTITDEQLDELYSLLDERWDRVVKQSRLLQELKRDNFALRMDIVSLLEDKTASEIKPGEISAARRAK